MKKLTLGSLFSGSGGFELAGILAGIQPVWNSEIEPYPILVTEKRLPDVQHFGDVNTLNGAELPPVDIITFGSPCQDMSIAGKRNGLDGSRSGLFHEAVRIIREMRCATNGQYPRFIVWENVPGAFSSNSGEDFRTVLEEICKIKSDSISVPRPPDKWTKAGEIVGEKFSVAWRVLDACGWGVPQRRKRIYLVADFDGQCAGNVLFESEGVSGYSAEGFRAWQGTACRAEKGSRTAGENICLCDQGGERIDVLKDKTATLRAESHHPPCVLESAGFCTEHSAKSRSIGYEEEKSPTLRAGVVPATVYENHSMDSRYTGPLEIAPTVAATYGMGGNNQPFVVENHPSDSRVKLTDDGLVQTLTSRCGTGGGNVPLLLEKTAPFSRTTRPHSSAEAETWKDSDTANTLNTFDTGETRANELVVQAFGICAKASNAMLSDNPHSGFYEAETSRTIDTSDQSPSKNQGGMAVVAIQGSMIGRSEKNGPQGSGISEDVSFTLDTADRHAVAYSTSKSSHHTIAEKDKTNTLVATDYKDPPTVSEEPFYIVRRLTPTECARLQGFPDWWCSNLSNENPSDAEIDRWTKIFETLRKAAKPDSKPKSRNAVIKWLKSPHSDSAEYKMWGNGIALPCAYFVLSGIAYFADTDTQE